MMRKNIEREETDIKVGDRKLQNESEHFSIVKEITQNYWSGVRRTHKPS